MSFRAGLRPALQKHSPRAFGPRLISLADSIYIVTLSSLQRLDDGRGRNPDFFEEENRGPDFFIKKETLNSMLSR